LIRRHSLNAFDGERVPGVIFPTGLVARGDAVQIYCGAADTSTAVAEISMDELISD
jgi:predicted GH43/DUF377 family glycosyl hydrolase